MDFTALVLAQHVQQSALVSATCHDVTLVAFNRRYRLHRIFLVQSSFFSSLLQGGFSEGARFRPPRGNHSNDADSLADDGSSHNGGNVLHLTFDDPNITRPAFEYSIALLYGAHPELVLPPWARPSPGNPLSSAWPPNFDVADDSMTASRQHIASSSVPPGSKMPATPRLLISLLATSIYLGIPSLTASTLTLIQSSFTPYTISTYMRFALGQPIVGAGLATGDDTWDWELEGPCWGFDRIGEWLGDEDEEEDDDDVRFVSERTQGMAFDGSVANIKREGQGGLADVVDDDDDEADDGGGRSISPLRRAKQQDTSNPSISVSSDSSKTATLDASMAPASSSLAALASATAAAASADSPATGSASLSPAFSPVTPALDYGPLSHRIGEACFCYLSRWGGEIAAEEQDKWTRDETKLEELVQQMEKHHSQQLRVVCEATVAYCLPRGQLPALLEVENSRSTDWDIPTPPLCVFSHPSLSHRAVLPGEAKPYSYDSEPPGLSTSVYGFDTDSDADGDESAQQQQPDDLTDFGAVSSLGMASSHLVDLLGSDAFFARSELERYEIAKDIVAMRRAQKSVAAAIVMTRGSGGEAAQSDEDEEGRSSLPLSQPSPPMTRARRSRLGTGAPATPSTPRAGGRSGKERDRMDLDDSRAMDIDVEEVDADDEHYARLFREGIYYSHLSFADLKRISQEAAAAASSTSDEDDDDDDDHHGSNLVDRPSTKNIYASSFWARANESKKKQSLAPAAPLETLQAALWAGNELKNHILSSANVSDPALEAAQPVLSPEGIRRGLAYTAEGSSLDTSMAGMTSSASGSGLANTTAPGGSKTTGPGNAATADVDESLLGISSPLRHFATALKQQADRRRATGLSRSSTPLSPMGTPSRTKQQQQHQRAPSSLGGLTFSSPLAGTSSSSSSSSLLSKRYFSVPVDDTIRYGEFFAGLLTGAAQAAAAAAQNVGASFAAATLAAAQPPVLGDQHSHEATGLAAMRDQNTLATMPGGSLAINPSGVNAPGSSSAAAAAVAATAGGPADPLLSQLGAVLVGGPFSDAKRSRANLYGLRNKLCKGKALGKVAAQVASRRAAERREGEEDRDLNDDEEESASAVPTKTLNDAPADSTDNAGGLSGANASHGGFLLGRLERRHWTGYEPMRVGVEYYGLDLLEEKQRLYSPSFFYAGSVWNLYVQTARKPRGMQLGVYLHRQSPNEPLPPASAPPEEVGLYQNHQAAEAGAQAQAAPAAASSNTSSFLPGAPRRRGAHIIHNAGAGAGGNVNTTTWRSMNRTHGAGSTLAAGPGPPVLPGVSPPIPYRDPRKMVRVYFSIHCHSPLGNSLTRFDSGPDRFSESQSWGWKSSSLMGIWELEGGKLSGGRGEASGGFRCVVTLGVV